jgi:hypothetical protein
MIHLAQISEAATRMAKDWTLGEKTATLKKETEYAVLVGLITPEVNETQAHEYMDELEFLATTAGAVTIKRFTQRAAHPEHRTFVGKGKLEEIRLYLERHEEVNMVIFDDDLTGKQTNNIEEALKVKIVDRSTLILDIFANRAQTAQAKAQVELAQMKYLLPRLRGLWTHLERQGGGIGMRGPGETQIETDRRLVQYRIKNLEEKLKDIDRQAQTQRKTRGELIRVALVGYTNVGKSTLLMTCFQNPKCWPKTNCLPHSIPRCAKWSSAKYLSCCPIPSGLSANCPTIWWKVSKARSTRCAKATFCCMWWMWRIRSLKTISYCAENPPGNRRRRKTHADGVQQDGPVPRTVFRRPA